MGLNQSLERRRRAVGTLEPIQDGEGLRTKLVYLLPLIIYDEDGVCRRDP